MNWSDSVKRKSSSMNWFPLWWIHTGAHHQIMLPLKYTILFLTWMFSARMDFLKNYIICYRYLIDFLLRAYEHVNSAISCFNLAIHWRMASDQCNLPKAYVPIAIDYDYFMVEWVILVLPPSTFTITSWCTQEPPRSQNDLCHGTIFTGTSHHYIKRGVI